MPDDPIVTADPELVDAPQNGHRRLYAGLTRGSRNITSGVCSFTLGRWPPGCGRISKELSLFRHLLERRVIDVRGEISEGDAKLIQSACRHEGAAQLYQRWLRRQHDDMTHFERMACLAKFEDATDKCDNCLKKLGLLDREAKNQWEGMRRIQARRAATKQNLEADAAASERGLEPAGGLS